MTRARPRCLGADAPPPSPMHGRDVSLTEPLVWEEGLDFVPRLPLDCLLLVFGSLPLSRRLRCRETCRAWRAALSDPAFWRVCNLSGEGMGAGGPVGLRRCEARLGLALRLSQGSITSLDLTGLRGLPFRTIHRALCACGGELREARLTHTLDFFTAGQVQQLLTAAPLLRLLEVDVKCSLGDAARLLAPCLGGPGDSWPSPLSLRELWVDQPSAGSPGHRADRTPELLQLSAAAAAHPRLASLLLQWLPLRGPCADALIGAATQRRLTFLYLVGCSLTPNHLPALTHLLLENDQLQQLWLSNSHTPLLTGDGLPFFCAALLSAAPRLHKLTLCCCLLWNSPADGVAIVDALCGRRRGAEVLELDVSCNEAMGQVAQRSAGIALGRLVANTELQSLNVDFNSLRDVGMKELCQSLPRSKTLRRLIATHNHLSTESLGDRLFSCMQPQQGASVRSILAAVKRNASLRSIRFGQPNNGALVEAETVVGLRARVAGAKPADSPSSRV